MLGPKVSVVIPVYRVKKEYFDNCILSLLHQTMQEIEIIIVCDGAKAEYVDYCREYQKKDDRIMVLEQQNSGAAVARNNGIAHAGGKYITFVDVDDWVEPEYCQFFYDIFEANEDVQIISSAAFLNRSEKEVKNPFWPGKRHIFEGKEKEQVELQAIYKEAAEFVPPFATFGTTWAKAYRLEWLKQENLRYEPELRRGQDTVFNLYAFERAEKILYVEQYLYHYRTNEDSTVNKYTDNVIEILDRIARHIYGYITEYHKDERFYKAYYNKKIQLLMQSMNCDYLHKNNPKSYSAKRKELKAVISKREYKKFFKNADKSKLPITRRIYWMLIRYRVVDLIFLANKIYS